MRGYSSDLRQSFPSGWLRPLAAPRREPPRCTSTNSRAPSTFVDNPPKGKQPSAGDAFVFANPVYTRHGGRVGSDHGNCTILRAKPLVAQCTSTLQLPQGQLMILNLNTGKPSLTAAVVGGTGEFAGAHGTLTTHTAGKADTLDIVLQ
jgi:hypothetical protein